MITWQPCETAKIFNLVEGESYGNKITEIKVSARTRLGKYIERPQHFLLIFGHIKLQTKWEQAALSTSQDKVFKIFLPNYRNHPLLLFHWKKWVLRP